MLITSVRKTKYGHRGYVKCINESDGKVIWTESTHIDRTCREDAQEDADRLKNDREATWRM